MLIAGLVSVGCGDSTSVPQVSEKLADLCLGESVAMNVRFTVRDADAGLPMQPSAMVFNRLTFKPTTAADPSTCAVSGTVLTEGPLPLAAWAGNSAPVTFQAFTGTYLGTAQRMVTIRQEKDPGSYADFWALLHIDYASGDWRYDVPDGRRASGGFRHR